MASQRLIGGFITFWLLFSGQAGFAIAPAPLEPATSAPSGPAPVVPAAPASPGSFAPSTGYIQPQNPALGGQADLPIPAAVALPANASGDTSTSRKFYTLTASLREVYDDNVSTSSNNPKGSLETDLSPSVLVDFPSASGDFSARYTFGMTYYTVAPNSSGNGSTGNNSTGNNQGQLQLTHELVAQYSNAFSDRFVLQAAESFRYFTEPSILQSTGTNYQSGPYFTNILNGTFTAQWTPLFSSTSTFADTLVKYQDAAVAVDQNSIENTGSTSLGYAFLPKITLSVGGILDNITYQSSDRGYTTYTAFVGSAWQALPSLSITGRGGLTYIQIGQVQGQSQSQDSTAPYAAVSVNWNLGARSALIGSYAHEVTPSDQTDSNGQIADRFNATFTYLITPRLNAHLDGVFTLSTFSSGLSGSGLSSDYQERDYEVDTGLTFQYNSEFNFLAGITVSGVSSNGVSNFGNNNYHRDEVYIGVRGTY